MGGGESLTCDAVARVPAAALYLSVNDHGVRFFKDHPELNRRCDYVVACDKIEKRARLDVGFPGLSPRDGRPWGVPVITRHMWGDYRLLKMHRPSSGMMAAWVARLMGCAPIILIGMDCYAAGTYHDAPKALSSGRSIAVSKHIDWWSSLLTTYPGQYRTLGGHALLQGLARPYDPREPSEPPRAPTELEKELGGQWIALQRDAGVAKRLFGAGGVWEFGTKEAVKLLASGAGRRVTTGEIKHGLRV